MFSVVKKACLLLEIKLCEYSPNIYCELRITMERGGGG